MIPAAGGFFMDEVGKQAGPLRFDDLHPCLEPLALHIEVEKFKVAGNVTTD